MDPLERTIGFFLPREGFDLVSSLVLLFFFIFLLTIENLYKKTIKFQSTKLNFYLAESSSISSFLSETNLPASSAFPVFENTLPASFLSCLRVRE